MPWIKDYVRSDGSPARGHVRLPAGARRETALLGLIVAGMSVFGDGTTTAGAGTRPGAGLPQPQSTAAYPTLSYPIAFPGSGSGR